MGNTERDTVARFDLHLCRPILPCSNLFTIFFCIIVVIVIIIIEGTSGSSSNTLTFIITCSLVHFVIFTIIMVMVIIAIEYHGQLSSLSSSPLLDPRPRAARRGAARRRATDRTAGLSKHCKDYHHNMMTTVVMLI